MSDNDDLVLDARTLAEMYKSPEQADTVADTVDEDVSETPAPDPTYAEVDPVTEPDNAPKYDEETAALARKFGWKPPEEWKGDRSNLIENPAEFLALQTRRLERTAEIEEQLRATRRELVELARAQQEMSNGTRQQRLDALKAERDRAFDVGDRKKFEALDKQYVELVAASREPEPRNEQPAPAPVDPDADRNFWDWHRDNAWYRGKDSLSDAMTYYADRIAAPQVVAEGLHPMKDGRAFYDRVAQLVQAQYGQRQNAMPPANQTDNRGSATPPRPGKTQQNFSSLPNDAQLAFRQWVRAGVFKDTEKDRAEYTRDYLAQKI